MKDLCVVGGGSTGLISALILKSRFEKLNISIIKSDKIGIIGVGEGSTEHWSEFMDICNISTEEVLKETGATLKYGVCFEGWTKQPYIHCVNKEINDMRFGQYLAGYSYSVINKLNPKDYIHPALSHNKKLKNNLPYQFHFNTFKLNDFLIKKCKERKIKIYTDDIVKVNIKNNKIKNIKSKTKKYKADFYIDSTGFHRILLSKLGAKWISYEKYLPTNHAIAFPTEDTEDYPLYTICKTMRAGWMWRAPVNGRWGNGYVFNDNYINSKEAQKECEEYLGYKIKIAKDIPFIAGSVDKAWIGNCVSMGVSSTFIEPLEASSIATSIQQTFLLMHLLINYTEEDINLYNKKFDQIVQNTLDFIVLHYLVNKNNSKFWKELKINLPPSLEKNLKKWKNRLPIQEDFEGNYQLFNEHNFTIILKELGLFDRLKIKKEFDTLSNAFKTKTNKSMKEYIKNNLNIDEEGTHKFFLNKYDNRR